MGFFNDTSNETESSSAMANSQNPAQDQINLVGKGTVFEGTVRAESDVRASGQIIGTLKVDGKAMIAESGSVDGEIIATNADIAGRVQGEVEVEERLVLKSTAEVDGNIKTDRLVVEEGAQFTGECQMGTPIAVNGEQDDEAVSIDDAEPDASAEDSTEDEEEPDQAPSTEQPAG
jgi:cytoskeletal protein CcmA (bactofilin family)